MKNSVYPVAVVGGGLLAQAQLAALKNIIPASSSILHIVGDELVDYTRYRGLALCAHKGAKANGPLGKILVEGHQRSRRYFERHHREARVPYYHLCRLSSPKFEDFHRRYLGAVEAVNPRADLLRLPEQTYAAHEQAYLVSLPHFCEQLSREVSRVVVHDHVVQVERHNLGGFELATYGGKSFRAEQVVLACARGVQLIGRAVDFLEQRGQKFEDCVGQFLSAEFTTAQKLGPTAINFENHQLLLQKNPRGHEGDWIVNINGGESDTLNFLGAEAKLNESYDILKGLLKESFPLPSREKFTLEKASRLKMRKRLPFFDEIDKGLYFAGGAYKNGLNVAFWGADKIAERIGAWRV